MNKYFTDKEKRIVWASTRSVLESDRYKRKKNGKKSKSHWDLFQNLLYVFLWVLKICGQFERGHRNARDIKINEVILEFANLPLSFNNYRILQLSDLHIDTLPGIEDVIISKINSVNYDLCVLTGDYRKSTHGEYKHVIAPLSKIITNINAKDGIIGILGNHDTFLMAPELEEMGIRMLINESMEINIGNDKIILTGTDDPYYYFTEMARDALNDKYDGFRIALIHTSELYDIAADNGCNLYLCGHTHGGQICLPGGYPLITHQFEGSRFYKGIWEYNNMKGYTNTGCGVSAIPVRFNSEGEITVLNLRRNTD